jgi:hypothetical protein
MDKYAGRALDCRIDIWYLRSDGQSLKFRTRL